MDLSSKVEIEPASLDRASVAMGGDTHLSENGRRFLLASLLESAIQPVVASDLNGIICCVNPAFAL